MKRNIFYILLIGLVTLYSCTDDFAELNTNPNQITDESLKQNFNHIGAYFPSMLEALSGNQVMHNLNNDSWVRHYATPTPFVGGVNNTTYYPRWIHQYWNRIYGSIMAPEDRLFKLQRQMDTICSFSGQSLFKFLEHLDLVLIMAQLFTLITGLKVMFCMIVKRVCTIHGLVS